MNPHPSNSRSTATYLTMSRVRPPLYILHSDLYESVCEVRLLRRLRGFGHSMSVRDENLNIDDVYSRIFGWTAYISAYYLAPE
jgi:hypothetical protein